MLVLDAASLVWLVTIGKPAPGRLASGAASSRGGASRPPSGSGPAGTLAEPMGLCAHAYELYVAEKAHHRVQVFTLSGESLRIIGAKGSRPGQLLEPSGCAVLPGRAAAEAKLIVAELGGARLQLLTLHGAPLQVVRLPAIGGVPPALRSVALSLGGRATTLWATDVTAHVLRRFSVYAVS